MINICTKQVKKMYQLTFQIMYHTLNRVCKKGVTKDGITSVSFNCYFIVCALGAHLTTQLSFGFINPWWYHYQHLNVEEVISDNGEDFFPQRIFICHCKLCSINYLSVCLRTTFYSEISDKSCYHNRNGGKAIFNYPSW